MKKNEKINVAIITARGGSKRIPRKNIKLFLGNPIIKYTITAALEADCFDLVMVSTDDTEIAEVAKSYGAQVPFLRSRENSDDYATTADVISEVTCELENSGLKIRYVCCLYPTAPFIKPERLIDAYKLLLARKSYSVVPIVKFSYPIWRSLKLSDSSTISMNWPEFESTRSQDLDFAYHDAGQFYFLDYERFKFEGKLFSVDSLGIELPEIEVQDIDTNEDWVLAESKFKYLQGIESREV